MSLSEQEELAKKDLADHSQAVDDTKLLAHLREDATIFWTSETWKDLASSWEVVATRLLEILAATHKAVKLK